MNIFDFIIFGVINVQKERQTFFIDLFFVGMIYYVHEVIVQFEFVHFNLSLVFYLFHQMSRAYVLIFFVYLDYEVFHQEKLLESERVQLFLGEHFDNEVLELIDFMRLSDALFAADQIIDPFVVPPSLFIVSFHLLPNALEGSNLNLDFVAEFINESKKTQNFSHNAGLVGMAFIVAKGLDHDFIDILFC